MNPKNKKGKSRLLKIIVIAAVILLLLAVVILSLQKRVTAKVAAGSGEKVKAAEVIVGSVSTTVSGSGSLADEDVEDIELPSSVELDEVFISAGDKISNGDLLASADMTTVLTAMKDLQDRIDDYDNELADAVSSAAGSTVTSPVEGRVKAVYCSYGDEVSHIMYENGALMIISIDGCMAVDVPSGSLKQGDTVTVLRADGSSLNGTVADIDGDNAVITVTDNGPLLNEAVTVMSASGNELGSGELYIHKPLKITGFAGTVSACYCQENSAVFAGTKLVYLSDTEYSANYDALLKERDELEDRLRQLVAIYKEGGLYAHMSGSVTYVAPEDERTGSSEEKVTVMSVCPDKTMTVSLSVDESDILSLAVGQKAEITVSSIGENIYTGTLTKLETSGSSSDGVTSYTAEITLPKAENMLPGMTAKVYIRIEGVDNALIIPSDALHLTSSNAFVYTGFNNDTGEYTGMTEVTVGINNGSYAEILSGLSEGDTVYYEPRQNSMFSYGGSPRGGSNQNGAQSSGMPAGGPPSGGMPAGGPPSGGAPAGGMRA